MDVIYFLVCIRRYESNVPTKICMTVGKKHNNTEKNAAFLSETTFLPYLMTAWCVFSYQSVYFFTNINGVYQDFHHNIMFL